ncbi:hypothetical protein PF005_g5149 [Phytophthora fragariae]|uniref:Uncharacterized protein n=1 Tax=Phytophthora fragariae TaxID=53985 RepID=A0A6A4A1M6_9STRA|nr:hypothetical protein PF003_g9706 [Phytophthora fragariae]KAE8946141.1 hypothetical protein PF009_g4233 [Phytophthora fragariae]KAE9022827.1 hypothetical protein PF011_g4277 [Phytophthora fragariae]KAE9128218.1 hypothetical protein PF007_g5336 [Phytophthora fragariae]KAE9151412.1 hypothetical protein PF006_g4291 [Phytophthora fragariae]
MVRESSRAAATLFLEVTALSQALENSCDEECSEDEWKDPHVLQEPWRVVTARLRCQNGRSQREMQIEQSASTCVTCRRPAAPDAVSKIDKNSPLKASRTAECHAAGTHGLNRFTFIRYLRTVKSTKIKSLSGSLYCIAIVYRSLFGIILSLEV